MAWPNLTYAEKLEYVKESVVLLARELESGGLSPGCVAAQQRVAYILKLMNAL